MWWRVDEMLVGTFLNRIVSWRKSILSWNLKNKNESVIWKSAGKTFWAVDPVRETDLECESTDSATWADVRPTPWVHHAGSQAPLPVRRSAFLNRFRCTCCWFGAHRWTLLLERNQKEGGMGHCELGRVEGMQLEKEAEAIGSHPGKEVQVYSPPMRRHCRVPGPHWSHSCS